MENKKEEEARIILKKKPKNPIVIEGFPGFGLVGTIAAEFIISHLKCEKIGRYFFKDQPSTVAIHNGQVIDPMSVYYNSKYNIIIIHSISGASGIEWEASDLVLDVCKQVGAKELISLEGVGAAKMGQEETEEPSRVFHYASKKENGKKLKAAGTEILKEGIIMGVTASLLLTKDIPLTCIFAETHSNLPDSKAAAKVIEVLDKYIGLSIDYKPLLKQAEDFEKKLKTLLEQSMKAKDVKEKKALSYVG